MDILLSIEQTSILTEILEIIETTIYLNSWSFEMCMNSMIGVYESRIISNTSSNQRLGERSLPVIIVVCY